ncbi:hypothetical protein BU23DRAFT_175137 [Bimuria novae-zelandiae CBS 107.79]|uniref:Uncharacterized protein n=1 Tax=Bimuria novae-zelandiae CBS 107.79 TaxID=1447943 RepID=A0A6A5V438_9PLEO|nr:hypothetical protein BU23DRAFT_175137 [Bimuria novae-zelandiae CBS 107.79]
MSWYVGFFDFVESAMIARVNETHKSHAAKLILSTKFVPLLVTRYTVALGAGFSAHRNRAYSLRGCVSNHCPIRCSHARAPTAAVGQDEAKAGIILLMRGN